MPKLCSTHRDIFLHWVFFLLFCETDILWKTLVPLGSPSAPNSIWKNPPDTVWATNQSQNTSEPEPTVYLKKTDQEKQAKQE